MRRDMACAEMPHAFVGGRKGAKSARRHENRSAKTVRLLEVLYRCAEASPDLGSMS
jgi:hypothetical protein